MQPSRRRILALDGGGIKGAFAAGFLEAIEENTGKKIAEHFDLIAGTSTGGIIALGLGLGMSAKEIAQFYVNDGPRIFGQLNALDEPGWISRLTSTIGGGVAQTNAARNSEVRFLTTNEGAGTSFFVKATWRQHGSFSHSCVPS